MSIKPKRPCAKCGRATHNRYCDACRPAMEKVNQGKRQRYDQERGTATQRGYDARWRRIRMSVLLSDPLCFKCNERGLITLASEVHHIIPLSQGGTHDYDNLMPLCKSCHSEITAREGGAFGNDRA